MNIVIADSHTICREALSHFIRHSDQSLQVESVGDYPGFLEAIDRQKPDLLIFDPELPGLAEACDALMFFQKNPSLRVGILATDMQADDTLYSSYVHGYFPKTMSSKEFVEGIHKVLKNETFTPAEKGYGRGPAQPRQSIEEVNLTTRERQVLSFLMRGAANKDIARALDLQVVTIKLHVRGICRKMNVKNRTQAALVAMENGWE
jgi:two-component system nitrate/nitrite response regulator NarL